MISGWNLPHADEGADMKPIHVAIRQNLLRPFRGIHTCRTCIPITALLTPNFSKVGCWSDASIAIIVWRRGQHGDRVTRRVEIPCGH